VFLHTFFVSAGFVVIQQLFQPFRERALFQVPDRVTIHFSIRFISGMNV
jgi:hypothetical protein